MWHQYLAHCGMGMLLICDPKIIGRGKKRAAERFGLRNTVLEPALFYSLNLIPHWILARDSAHVTTQCLCQDPNPGESRTTGFKSPSAAHQTENKNATANSHPGLRGNPRVLSSRGRPSTPEARGQRLARQSAVRSRTQHRSRSLPSQPRRCRGRH